MFQSIHHIAIICSNYEISKQFYVEKLGFSILAETYREERQSYKLDLALGDHYVIELFSFPDAPKRPSYPEAQGLRHLAFSVENIEETIEKLEGNGIKVEPVRKDPLTEKLFAFFGDPDGLPIELYET
ncbi:VOC family protein [Radiobacillus kanasensis]|uniref:SMU1112c/YaeR family gloxylase I-like metalloprotein n=1 Tax=Radiobacillus kanasensis TaxID=2844358 RepID=UPI001E2E31C1|nr:VOC family protein [Radiobacillus kanasensis]UFT98590.1 VOC family protein [Radiobacillus kanasensis]